MKKKKATKTKKTLWSKLTTRVDDQAQFFAWIGTLLILGGYFLTTFDIIKNTDPIYHGMNLLGAIGIISISLPKHIYQSVFLNSVWAIVALVGLFKLAAR